MDTRNTFTSKDWGNGVHNYEGKKRLMRVTNLNRTKKKIVHYAGLLKRYVKDLEERYPSHYFDCRLRYGRR